VYSDTVPLILPLSESVSHNHTANTGHCLIPESVPQDGNQGTANQTVTCHRLITTSRVSLSKCWRYG